MKKPARQALRSAARRIESALEDLDGAGPVEERVHGARRKLKKARACLRLLPGTAESKERRRLDGLCRDAGRALGPARDGAALERAFESLKLANPGGGLLAQRRRAAERALAEEGGLEECLRALERAERGCRRLDLDGAGWKPVGANLDRCCRRLARAFARAQSLRTDAAFHEWRKRAKDLRYQLELLAEPKQRSIGRVIELLKTLSDLLGDDHDLAELGGAVAGEPDAFGGMAAAGTLAQAIMRRRRALRRAALALGRRWTPDKPGELARRARESWKRAPKLKE